MTYPGTFAEVCRHSWDCSYAGFELSRVADLADQRDRLVEVLARATVRHKSAPSVFDDLVQAAGWTVASSQLEPRNVSIWHGDLGEVIAAEAAAAFDNLKIPILKLRYQIDPNQTLPGADVVGFEFDEDSNISNIRIYEAKFRLDPRTQTLIEAHDQVASDVDSGFATTVCFIASRLHESNLELYEAFLSYLRDRRANHDFSYALCLTSDSSKWMDTYLDNLADLPELLHPLLVRIVLLSELRHLAQTVLSRIRKEHNGSD